MTYLSSTSTSPDCPPPGAPHALDAGEAALAVVHRYTAIATATGAVPVPATTGALIAETAFMVNEVAACYGVAISTGTIAASLGAATGVNMVGRAVFVEAARAMGWFAGPFGVAGVSALGAATAGVQTYVVGRIAMAVAANRGLPLGGDQRRRVLAEAREDFEATFGGTRSRDREPTER